MEIDPKLVILIISNQLNGKELFRVHIHELSIRFDEKFQEGIEKHDDLKQEIGFLNDMWKSHKIEQSQIFPIMLDIMYRYGDYIKDYYFDNNDLNKEGKFIEKNNLQTKPELFFLNLKNQNLLKKITKKTFEHSIRSLPTANKYVDLYRKKSKYYHYYKNNKIAENWYFMEYNNQLIFCFLNK